LEEVLWLDLNRSAIGVEEKMFRREETTPAGGSTSFDSVGRSTSAEARAEEEAEEEAVAVGEGLGGLEKFLFFCSSPRPRFREEACLAHEGEENLSGRSCAKVRLGEVLREVEVEEDSSTPAVGAYDKGDGGAGGRLVT
jgi:hypothetical protein